MQENESKAMKGYDRVVAGLLEGSQVRRVSARKEGSVWMSEFVERSCINNT